VIAEAVVEAVEAIEVAVEDVVLLVEVEQRVERRLSLYV
jgi:hypothetical protein